MVCNKNTSLDLIIWKTFIKKSSKIFRKLKVFKTSDGKSFRLKALGLKIKNWIQKTNLTVRRANRVMILSLRCKMKNSKSWMNSRSRTASFISLSKLNRPLMRFLLRTGDKLDRILLCAPQATMFLDFQVTKSNKRTKPLLYTIETFKSFSRRL